jgi:hypothetical protein
LASRRIFSLWLSLSLVRVSHIYFALCAIYFGLHLYDLSAVLDYRIKIGFSHYFNNQAARKATLYRMATIEKRF